MTQAETRPAVPRPAPKGAYLTAGLGALPLVAPVMNAAFLYSAASTSTGGSPNLIWAVPCLALAAVGIFILGCRGTVLLGGRRPGAAAHLRWAWLLGIGCSVAEVLVAGFWTASLVTPFAVLFGMLLTFVAILCGSLALWMLPRCLRPGR